MPTPQISKDRVLQVISVVEEKLRVGHRPPGITGHGDGAIGAAAKALGVSFRGVSNALDRGEQLYGLRVDWSLYLSQPVKPIPPELAPEPSGNRTAPDLIAMIRRQPMTLDEVAAELRITRGQVLDAFDSMIANGANIRQIGDRWTVPTTQEPAFARGAMLEYTSRPDNTFLFGALGDNHLGSKYERLDCLNDLYDRYAKAGVDRVFNTGNWIDGVTSFNVHDLLVHGMESQLRYLAKHYPRRPGIVTYAVTGEDHEGWFSRREGIDIGKRAEQTMREEGRDDWIDLGFMEAHVKLVNANTGKSSILAVVHPGGGTSYALSYTVQKIIEALEGGEKPAVSLYGHYHKLWSGNIRNVWVVCTGCTQDQTVFTRNKIRQEVHVGGTMVELEQDPGTGAIVAMTPKLIRYFVKNYYADRWSKAGEVVSPERAP
jgi:uncharacterized protein (DUF433 family)